MKNTDLAYMAGIFDGEGTIGLHKYEYKKKNGMVSKYHYLDVSIVNMVEWVPWHFKMAFGGSVCCRANNLWVWTTRNQKAASCLSALFPYLKLKRRQAEIAIALQARTKLHGSSRVTPEEQALREAEKILISRLNHRKDELEV